MEENGEMKWNPKTGYYEYKSAVNSLFGLLGIGVADWEIRPELAPYLTYTIKYLVQRLVDLGEDADIRDKLQEVFDIFKDGADLIVDDNGKILAEQIGIDTSPVDPSEVTELDENSEEDCTCSYDQDRFIFTWTNVMSCLITRLKIMYASLLVDPVSQGCPCCCGKGETYKDWEKYTSGVYPEDEEYDRYDVANTTTAGWRVGSRTPECNCGCRK